MFVFDKKDIECGFRNCLQIKNIPNIKKYMANRTQNT